MFLCLTENETAESFCQKNELVLCIDHKKYKYEFKGNEKWLSTMLSAKYP